MVRLTRFLCLLLPILLTGCSYSSSYVQTKDKAYLSAHSTPPLRIPPGISSSAFDNYYPVSDRTYPDKAKDVSLVPPGLSNGS